jgi:hypothetical protein
MMLSHMARPGWMCLEDEWILWRKIMDTIKSDAQTIDVSSYRWVHEWLDKITLPVANPDESGILMTTEAIRMLAERARITVPYAATASLVANNR